VPPLAPTCSVALSDPKITVTYTTPIGTSPALYAEIWRYDTVNNVTARIATNLRAGTSNQTYQDYTPAHGIGYQYWSRAVATDKSYTDSSKTAVTTLTMARACISDVLNPASNNALLSNTQMDDAQDYTLALLEFKNALAPVAQFGDLRHRLFKVTATAPTSELSTQYANLQAIQALEDTVCYRDPSGNKLFCSMPKLDAQLFSQGGLGAQVTIELKEVYYNENLSAPS
jgi:hypothetical protein